MVMGTPRTHPDVSLQPYRARHLGLQQLGKRPRDGAWPRQRHDGLPDADGSGHRVMDGDAVARLHGPRPGLHQNGVDGGRRGGAVDLRPAVELRGRCLRVAARHLIVVFEHHVEGGACRHRPHGRLRVARGDLSASPRRLHVGRRSDRRVEGNGPAGAGVPQHLGVPPAGGAGTGGRGGEIGVAGDGGETVGDVAPSTGAATWVTDTATVSDGGLVVASLQLMAPSRSTAITAVDRRDASCPTATDGWGWAPFRTSTGMTVPRCAGRTSPPDGGAGEGEDTAGTTRAQREGPCGAHTRSGMSRRRRRRATARRGW